MNAVLGPYPAYVNLAVKLGASFFSMPASRWRGMNLARQWAVNRNFLIKRLTLEVSSSLLAIRITPDSEPGFIARSNTCVAAGLRLCQPLRPTCRNEDIAMPDSFAEYIGKRLERLRKGRPSLVHCEYDEEHFGNAHAVFELGKLRLHFLDDRGLEAIDVEIADGHDGTAVVPLENLAVTAELLSLEDLLYHYGLSEQIADSSLEDDPPPGPFLTLKGAIELLGEQWDQLVDACGNETTLRRVSEVQEVIQNRLADSLSTAPGETPGGLVVKPTPSEPSF